MVEIGDSVASVKQKPKLVKKLQTQTASEQKELKGVILGFIN